MNESSRISEIVNRFFHIMVAEKSYKSIQVSFFVTNRSKTTFSSIFGNKISRKWIFISFKFVDFNTIELCYWNVYNLVMSRSIYCVFYVDFDGKTDILPEF